MRYEKAFETKLNVILSTLFNEKLGLQTISETRQGRGRPDILIFIGGLKIILEGSYSKKDAEIDVRAKVERGFADIGIALHYKEAIRDVEDNLVKNAMQKSKFDVRIFIPKDISDTLDYHIHGKQLESISKSDWFETDISDLTSLIKNNIEEVLVKEESIKQLIQEIEAASDDFVHRVKSMDTTKKISENLYTVFYRLNGLDIGDYKKISELIYANAFLTLLLSVAFYQSIQPHLLLESLGTLAKRLGKKEGLSRAFQDIQKIDYTPIYQVASEAIEYLTSDSVFDGIINIGRRLGGDRSLLRSDYSGIIYHRVVGDWSIRKGFATYFTTIPASYLLAYLAIFSTNHRFVNTENMKICDFACGSGTLLTASYSALTDRYTLDKFEEGEIDLDTFYKKMLEDNIWGFDAMRYALQIASLNLVFHNPSIALNNLHLYATPLGLTRKGNIELGSLRYLESHTLVQHFPVEDTAIKTTSLDINDHSDNLPKFDLIIMNPPYTRATGRGGKEHGGLFGFLVDSNVRNTVLNEYNKARNKVNKSLLHIGNEHLSRFEDGSFGGISLAGEGLIFIYLSYLNLNDHGTIAFVLPKTALSGASWFLIRTLLFEKLHIQYVVVSYDKVNGNNFSESTELSELLIVASKVQKVSDSQMTKFVILLTKPQNFFEAKGLARSIVNNNEKFLAINESKAYIVNTTRRELKESIDNWGRFTAFPNIHLIEFVRRLILGECFEKNIPITRLGRIATIGIDWKQFTASFRISNEQIPGSHPAIYGGKEEQKKRMLGQSNKFIVPVDDGARKIFHEKASCLLVPDRIRVTTSHVISVLVSSETLKCFLCGKTDSRERSE